MSNFLENVLAGLVGGLIVTIVQIDLESIFPNLTNPLLKTLAIIGLSFFCLVLFSFITKSMSKKR